MATLGDISAFQYQFAELASVPVPRIAASLDMSDIFLDVNAWANPADFPLARLLWAAAWTALQEQNIANGADGTGMSDLFAATVRFSDRTVTYQQREYTKRELSGSVGDALLERTIYGQMYLTLRDRNIVPILVI